MKYKITITHTAEKYLNKLAKKNYDLVVKVIYSLADDPCQPGVRKLQGVDGTYRIRAGNYRVLYKISNGELTVTVIKIGDRRDVYN
ncbi:type II toxin-antitoxin system RelE family toxin [Dyadobacter sp. OTU695]|uniref:type II toxin-antitoxin system RelE family toxin n=1 Tax=Dyadobacter sp. OTU695 TaxID=3043860 RepID=UPI00406D04A8